MCCASKSFSLCGSLRTACAAAAASGAVTGSTAWRASSRLRKSNGRLRNEGSSFFFSLMIPPSTPLLTVGAEPSLLAFELGIGALRGRGVVALPADSRVVVDQLRGHRSGTETHRPEDVRQRHAARLDQLLGLAGIAGLD